MINILYNWKVYLGKFIRKSWTADFIKVVKLKSLPKGFMMFHFRRNFIIKKFICAAFEMFSRKKDPLINDLRDCNNRVQLLKMSRTVLPMTHIYLGP